ncbi:alcohol dehydrogenase catalytic domain-containing protein [Pseudomonas sp. H2_E05]
MVPGHEFFGYVEQVGEGAEEHFEVQVGDKVIAEQIVPCAKVSFLQIEFDKRGCVKCTTSSTTNVIVAEGGMAQYMRIPRTAIVHKIPAAVSLEELGAGGADGLLRSTINRGDIQHDDVVVITIAEHLGLKCMVQSRGAENPEETGGDRHDRRAPGTWRKNSTTKW